MLWGFGALGAAALAGCSSASATPITQGEVQLNFWAHDPGYDATFAASAVDPAIQQGSRWTYELEMTAANAGDLVSRAITQAVARRRGPDLIGVVVDQFPRMMKSRIAQNMLVPLDDLIQPFGDQLLKQGSYTSDGSVYGLESDNSISVLYYRQDVFQENDIPETVGSWEELAEAGTRLAATTGQAIGMVSTGDPGAVFNSFLQFLLQRGGSVFGADGSLTLDSDESREVLAFMRKGVQDGFLMPLADPYGGAVAAALKNSELVATVMPNWYRAYGLEANVPDQEGLWKIRTIPPFQAGGHIASTLGGTGFAVASDTARSDAAVELLRRTYLTPEGQFLRYQKGGYLPTLAPLYQEPQFLEITDPFLGGQRIFEVYGEAALDMPAFDQHVGMQVMTTTLGGPVLDAVMGRSTPDQAIAAAVAAYRNQVRQ
ncbi:hypothetical protein GCM10027456_65030 [Kineosporia babensis]